MDTQYLGNLSYDSENYFPSWMHLPEVMTLYEKLPWRIFAEIFCLKTKLSFQQSVIYIQFIFWKNYQKIFLL